MQVKEIGSVASARQLREKLLEAARRRQIDVVLVWRLDRWGPGEPWPAGWPSPVDLTLEQLHDVLQLAMGWEDCHMHAFRIGQRRFGKPEPNDRLMGLPVLGVGYGKLKRRVDAAVGNERTTRLRGSLQWSSLCRREVEVVNASRGGSRLDASRPQSRVSVMMRTSATCCRRAGISQAISTELTETARGREYAGRARKTEASS